MSRTTKHPVAAKAKRGHALTSIPHRFKPGNNANPKGRPKGSRNQRVIVREILLETVTVREGGEPKQMPKIEALLKKTVSDALAGDRKAASIVLGLAQNLGLLTPEPEEVVGSVSEDDAAIIESYGRRVLATQAASGIEIVSETDGTGDRGATAPDETKRAA